LFAFWVRQIARGLAAFYFVVDEPIYARDGFKQAVADNVESRVKRFELFLCLRKRSLERGFLPECHTAGHTLAILGPFRPHHHCIRNPLETAWRARPAASD
ncbi:MAG: hypothetical protein ACXWKC_10525, partial [Xanthobacteraceae bacterium]